MNIIKRPKPGEHIIIAGTTGSGKSKLGELFLNGVDSYFAIDPQDSLNLPGSVKINSPDNLKMKLIMFKKIRYVPKVQFQNRQTYNYIFKTILHSSTKKKPRPRVIYIDEIYNIGYGANFPEMYPKLLTMGRQRKISVWTATQRPSMIPIPSMSECKYLYLFYITYTEDIKKIAKFARNSKKLISDLEEMQVDHSFIEVDIKTGTWRKLKRLALNSEIEFQEKGVNEIIYGGLGLLFIGGILYYLKSKEVI